MERENSGILKFGDQMPSFVLPNVDGKEIDNSYFADKRGSLVIFACNHCPYVKGAIWAFKRIAKLCVENNIGFVVISSNDASKYPEDSFLAMGKFASDNNISWPYLYDATQEVAKSFDAACTPESYFFSGGLKYHGALIDQSLLNKETSSSDKLYLENYLREFIADCAIDSKFVRPVGCSIKWR